MSTGSGPMDGQLFQVRQLLVLREGIAPFQANFTAVDRVLDFSHLRDQLRRIAGAPGALFRLGSDNAVLGLVSRGTPRVLESQVPLSHTHTHTDLLLSIRPPYNDNDYDNDAVCGAKDDNPSLHPLHTHYLEFRRSGSCTNCCDWTSPHALLPFGSVRWPPSLILGCFKWLS